MRTTLLSSTKNGLVKGIVHIFPAKELTLYNFKAALLSFTAKALATMLNHQGSVCKQIFLRSLKKSLRLKLQEASSSAQCLGWMLLSMYA